MNTSKIPKLLIATILFVSGFACQTAGNTSTAAATPTDKPDIEQNSREISPTPAITTQATIAPSGSPPAATEVLVVQPTAQELIRQWGIGAAASSQLGEEDWSAIQAAGAPDTPDCVDSPSTWASLMGSEQEWLEVYYETAVIPSEVNIYETYGATQVTKVELLDTNGKYHEIYTGEPSETECPFVMQIGVTNWDYEAVAVKISFDESFLHYWNEIDAVELVGLSTGKVVATPSALFTTPTPFAAPSGFLWRVGGKSSPSEIFSVPDGVDVAADGSVYVADMMKGILIFDQDGHQKNLISSSKMDSVADIAVAPNGNLYVASWGNNSVLAYDGNGKLLWSIGSEGTGPGQFAQFSPQILTVGPDGEIYVLDKTKDESGADLHRIQVLSPDGQYMREITISDEWFLVDDMDFGPDGNLYVLSGFAQYILVLKPDGSVFGRIGKKALGEAYISTGIDIDNQGNIYVASGHLDQGVLMLDKYGEVVKRIGKLIEDGQRPWPEGGFYAPMGLGVMPDGSRVFVTDHSGPYAYLNALTFK